MSVEATREPSFLLAKPEKRLLQAIASRLPHWILPNDLTALGVAAALGICVAYQLSNQGNAWLWVASTLLIVHWLGDSLDGTLRACAGPSGRATATTSTISSTPAPPPRSASDSASRRTCCSRSGR